ncbi:ATP-binding protein [Aquabacterium soli]|uniref:ATP-binding protein n=1 Tax=Aquabacterium soli TaxID=2493092 RepID=UPI00131574BC|nr:ATP-binding protein [Aquabacterium soli]
MKIRTRLLWLVFAAWLPSAIAIGLVARSEYVELKSSALQDVRRLADGLNSIVERELDKRFVMARTLSASTALQLNDLARFYIEASLATKGMDSWVALYRPGRQVLNTRFPYDPLLAVPVPELALWLTSGEASYFDRSGPLVKQPLIGVIAAQAITPVDFNVVVAFDPAVLNSAISKLSPSHGAIVSIVDKDLKVMARSKDHHAWLGREATVDMKQRALAGRDGFEPSITLDKVPALTYLSLPNRHGWYTIVALPQETLDHEARHAAVKAIGLAATLLGLSLLLALYVARSVSEPLLALEEAAEELGQERVPQLLKTGISEADRVARALRDAGVRIKESADVLEAKVNDAVARTAEVQQRLADAQKREALGRLAGGVAHDFNNLLQTISAALHLMVATTPEGPPRRMLDAATRATGKAADLVKQMLAFGRAQKLQPAAVNINDFLLKVCDLAGKAAGTNINIHANVAPGLPAVFVDPSQLELALLNLIFNARDAMQGRGEIKIHAFLAVNGLSSASPAQSAFVQIDVSDNGPGMDASTLRKAFDPYFTTKPVGSGSGLGLAQVLSFARQSGGDAHIVSEQGRGTNVQLILPSTTAVPTASASASTGAVAAGRPLRVLMVEDDSLVASVVLSAIEGMGHCATHCLNAEKAKELITQGERFDVVFSDVVMPGAITGFDLAEWCQTLQPPIPVVLATGYSAQSPETDVVVLRKPYDLNDLARALQQAAGADITPALKG